MACCANTDWIISRNRGFSEKESGVGGRAVVVPMASRSDGGSDGSSESIWDDPLDGKAYWSC
jgi:hypothetical protein